MNTAIPSSCRTELRRWLQSQAGEYPYALTLTFKQSHRVETPEGEVWRLTCASDCEAALKKLQQKLNRAYFGRYAADKGYKSLRYLVVLEGEVSSKHLHAHMAIGGFPKDTIPSSIKSAIEDAKKLVPLFDERFELDIADSGWHEYLAKEATASNTDNMLWQICT